MIIFIEDEDEVALPPRRRTASVTPDASECSPTRIIRSLLLGSPEPPMMAVPEGSGRRLLGEFETVASSILQDTRRCDPSAGPLGHFVAFGSGTSPR